jgi:hypothetical protein
MEFAKSEEIRLQLTLWDTDKDGMVSFAPEPSNGRKGKGTSTRRFSS